MTSQFPPPPPPPMPMRPVPPMQQSHPFGHPQLVASGADAHADLQAAQAAGRRARVAVIFGAIGYIAYDVAQFVSNIALGDMSSATPVTDSEMLAALMSLVLMLAAIAAMIVAGIMFLIWMYKSALISKRFSIPARLSPGLGVGSYFIPIVSLWFPYQAAADVYPVGHPNRKRVGMWWGLFLGMTLGSYIVLFTAAVPALQLVAVLASAGVIIAAAVTARAMITDANRFHHEKIYGVTQSRG